MLASRRTPRASRQATPVMQGKSLHHRAFSGATVTRAWCGAGIVGVELCAEVRGSRQASTISCEMAAGSTEETFGLLLNVLAQSLDVQEIFVKISALARETVPHDRLMFGLVTEDGERYRILAVSEDETQEPLTEIPLSALSRR